MYADGIMSKNRPYNVGGGQNHDKNIQDQTFKEGNLTNPGGVRVER